MSQLQVGCADAVRRLWEYLEHELDAASHAEVEAHLAWCRRCCGELEFARELKGLLRGGASEPVPDDVRSRLERVIDDLDAGPEGEC